VALATPAGRGALAVIRISGPDVRGILERLGAGRVMEVPAREATLVRLIDPRDASLLDHAMATFFPGPASYTGDDLAEITVHGGLIGPRQVLEVCIWLGGREAEPGEFTRRRWAAGKMDRLQVEGLEALVEADTPTRHRLALSRLEGALSRRLDGLRDGLLQVEAYLAHHLDFPDEDEPPTSMAQVIAALREVEGRLAELQASAPLGQRIREGALVVLAGRPNAGKSSLFNAILGEERVLVSPEEGTTRDVIEVGVDFSGVPVRLLDTAGLRKTEASIEASGIEMARRWLEGADLIVWLHRAAWGPPTAQDRQWLEEVPAVRAGEVEVLPLASCVDEVGGVENMATLGEWEGVRGVPWIPLSVSSGFGLDEFMSAVFSRLVGSTQAFGAVDQGTVLVREEEARAVAEALSAVREAVGVLEGGLGAEIAAVEVRHAGEVLAGMVGPIEEEAVLDRLFSTFCIGK